MIDLPFQVLSALFLLPLPEVNERSLKKLMLCVVILTQFLSVRLGGLSLSLYYLTAVKFFDVRFYLR